jgi:Na+-driven multidrug efflux pump
MLRFAAIVGGGLSVVFGLCAFTPLREGILVDLLGEKPDGAVLALAEPALMLAVAQPLLSAIRFGLRGVLISRGQTRPITAVNVLTLLLLAAAIALEFQTTGDNGALNAYVIWTAALLIEIALLARAAARGAPVPPLLPPPVRTPRESTAG